MKTSKISILIFSLIISSTSLYAQKEYKIALQNSKEGKLILKDFNGDLPVVGYNGNDIIISTDSEGFTPPEKAKGLKPVYPSGTDNTGLGLDVEKSENQVTVTCLVPFTRGTEYKIMVPENIAIEAESSCERSNSIKVSGTKNEIDIDNCHDVVLENVTGPLVLSTISGNIDITFSSINTEKPFSINSVSGDIDIALPSKTSADIELRTVGGSFYSDFEMNDTEKNLKRVGGSQINFPLNGGGQKFRIVTVTGDIYLRKAK